MANNGSQYDPRAQAMEEVHFDWRCIVCCMVALSPFIWKSNTSLGLNLFILIWTIPLGLNVTSAIPPFIYSVGPGNHFMLLDPDIFFVLFFVAGNFRSDFSCHPFLFRLICLFFFLRWVEGLYVPMVIRKRRKRKKRNQTKRIRTRTRTGPLERKPRPSETPVWAEGPHTGINLQEILQQTQ